LARGARQSQQSAIAYAMPGTAGLSARASHGEYQSLLDRCPRNAQNCKVVGVFFEESKGRGSWITGADKGVRPDSSFASSWKLVSFPQLNIGARLSQSGRHGLCLYPTTALDPEARPSPANHLGRAGATGRDKKQILATPKCQHLQGIGSFRWSHDLGWRQVFQCAGRSKSSAASSRDAWNCRENGNWQTAGAIPRPSAARQQRRSEGQQFSIALQIIPGKGGDGVSPQRRLCKITAEFLPGTAPNFRNRKLGLPRRIDWPTFPPTGWEMDFQRGKELRSHWPTEIAPDG